MPGALAIPVGVVVVVTGALYFADRQMKTADNYFRGFPAVWNLVAFYLYVIAPPPWLAAAGVIGARGLDVRAGAVRASVARQAVARLLNIALLALWAALALIAVIANLEPGPYVRCALAIDCALLLGGRLVTAPSLIGYRARSVKIKK